MSGIAADPVHVAISIAVLVVILGWVALLAVLLLYYAVVIVARKGSVRSVVSAPGLRGSAGARRPGSGPPLASLDQLRRADPRFDPQLLLDAAQTAAMLMFVATSTGDEAPISRVTTESFWQTTQGRLVQTTARDRRRSNEYAASSPNGSKSRQQAVPIDYQASAPELAAIRLGRQQEISVRVAFGQLAAFIRPGAAAFAAGAAATTLTSGFVNMGRAVAAQADNQQSEVSWGGADGHYMLTFVRPAGVQTDPAAALADRTCTTCGATYQSELAVACQHCGTARPMPWGQWRLAHAAPAG